MRLIHGCVAVALALAGVVGCHQERKSPQGTSSRDVKSSQPKAGDARSGGSASASAAAGTSQKSLYERLGGQAAITAVIDDFVNRTAANPKVNFTRQNVPGVEPWQATPENVAKLKRRLVQFVSMATGGPKQYEGKDMKTAHQGMKITEAEFTAIAGDLAASLDKFKVPQKEKDELMAVVGSTKNAIVEQR